MDSLVKAYPSVDWKAKKVTCYVGNKKYNLPTCNLDISDDNSFANLPTNDHEDTPGTELSPHDVCVPVSDDVARQQCL